MDDIRGYLVIKVLHKVVQNGCFRGTTSQQTSDPPQVLEEVSVGPYTLLDHCVQDITPRDVVWIRYRPLEPIYRPVGPHH